MKFSTVLKMNAEQQKNLHHFVSYTIYSQFDNVVTIDLVGDKLSIQRVLSMYADSLQQKTFAAKAALEELIEEVQTHHGCKGHGTSKSVLIQLDLNSDGDVCDHFAIYKNSRVEGLQVTSYEYDWIDEGQE
ncbi:hypothetical protein KNT87_gp127 [Erwinia phage Cronus]|uniref:Uncharacterized protein n=1 Tax=Erwinia phage Cronus TaxID=2163633 RepID=A0A2S1GMG0_9CAUD|nr:hypothetical protein KNT87_gp127 [Erwinia phage Cronus]AWD90566.1 hypothetical protein [Erwinia phage Cronus]